MKDLTIYLVYISYFESYIVKEKGSISIGKKALDDKNSIISLSLSKAMKENNKDEVKLIKKIISLRSNKKTRGFKLVMVDKRHIPQMKVSAVNIYTDEKILPSLSNEDYSLFIMEKGSRLDIEYYFSPKEYQCTSFWYKSIKTGKKK